MNANNEPLLVEVYLRGGRVNGVTRQVGPRGRLVEVLTATTESMFELESAEITIDADGTSRQTPSMVLGKGAILIAIPRETAEQKRNRAFLNAGIDRSRRQVRLDVLLPPLFIEGMAHLPAGAGQLRLFLKTFAYFFPLTSATVHLPNGTTLEEPVILVNRDAVTALSLPPAAAKEQVSLVAS